MFWTYSNIITGFFSPLKSVELNPQNFTIEGWFNLDMLLTSRIKLSNSLDIDSGLISIFFRNVFAAKILFVLFCFTLKTSPKEPWLIFFNISKSSISIVSISLSIIYLKWLFDRCHICICHVLKILKFLRISCQVT